MYIKEISYRDCLQIRQAVLRPHQKAEDCIFNNDTDSTSFHLGAYRNDLLVGIATFISEQKSQFEFDIQYRLRGMAVLQEFQRHGIGKLLLSRGEDLLKKKNCSLIWCNGRINAVTFYQNNAFMIKGDKFDIPGIGFHYLLYKII